MGETAEKLREKRNAEVQQSLNSDPTKLIDWFDDLGTGNEKYRFLSNFYEGEPITVSGLGEILDLPVEAQFQTGEHLFQAFKARSRKDFLAIGMAKARTVPYTDKAGKKQTYTESAPGMAKALGRALPLRADWEQIKFDVMALTVRAKFASGREEAERLLATGDAYLQEGTWWGDDTWGVLLDEEGRPGRNWLGTLLMMRRAELRSGLDTIPFTAMLANLDRAGVNWL